MADAEQFDESALARLRQFGGDKLLRNMSTIFLEHAPTRTQAAREGVRRADAGAVCDALHALKSSAAQLGAARLSVHCAEGEALARGGKLETMPALLDTIDKELAATRDWLTARAEVQ